MEWHCNGQAGTQCPHPIHFCGNHWISGFDANPSGLWHHAQRKLQPLQNTFVRIPGPSCIEKRCMLNTKPVGCCIGITFPPHPTIFMQICKLFIHKLFTYSYKTAYNLWIMWMNRWKCPVTPSCLWITFQRPYT